MMTIFEIKLDGFRALAYLEKGEGRLVSRNGNTFASFRELAAQLAASFRGTDAVLDVERARHSPNVMAES
jgi:ATP-dependent DNA ligase